MSLSADHIIPQRVGNPRRFVAYGANTAEMQFNSGSIPLGCAAARIKRWEVHENPGTGVIYIAPLITGPTAKPGRGEPDFNHPLMNKLNGGKRVAEGNLFQSMQGRVPSGTYAMTWKGTGVLEVISSVAGVITGVLDHTPAGINRIEYTIDGATLGNGTLALRVHDSNTVDPLREMHVWLPGCWRVNANLTTEGGSLLNPEYVAQFRKMNGGSGPFAIRSLGWNDTTNIGATFSGVQYQASPFMRHDVVNHTTFPSLDKTMKADEIGVNPIFMVALCNELDAHLFWVFPHQAIYANNPRPIASFELATGQAIGDATVLGTGYKHNVVAGAVLIVDRSETPGTGATATADTDANGDVSGLTLVLDGADYNHGLEISIELDPVAFETDLSDNNFYARARLDPAPARDDTRTKQLTDAQYEAWIKLQATIIKDGLASHGTEWNYGLDIPGLKTALSLIGEAFNEVWNTRFALYTQLWVVAATATGADSAVTLAERRTAHANEAERIWDWIKVDIFGEAIGVEGRARLHMGGALSNAAWLSGATGVLSQFAGYPTPTTRIDSAGGSGYFSLDKQDEQAFNGAVAQGIKRVATSVGGTGYTNGAQFFVPSTGQCPGARAAQLKIVASGGVITAIQVLQSGDCFLQSPLPTITPPGGSSFVGVADVGTGLETDPDYPDGETVALALRNTMTTFKNFQDVEYTNGSDAITDYVNPGGGTVIEQAAYEAGPHLDPGSQPYAAMTILAVRDPAMYDVYVNPVDTLGYVAAMADKGIKFIMWFEFMSIAGVGSAGGGPFGHFEFMDDEIPNPVLGAPVAGASQVPKAYAICRAPQSPEREIL